ncbi:hypothetical protein [Streptomyces sp. DSM 40907]|uniref:hypothetical protein n=1 Tax=Streptomyces kutzneri TaxID=3051179 RepID=UPI0028D6CCD2|nr:hypothetical protein [Streptomyces sp. DSM 40907]
MSRPIHAQLRESGELVGSDLVAAVLVFETHTLTMTGSASPSTETSSPWALGTGRRATAERQRTEVFRREGATYDQARARRIVEESVRREAAAKNRPADLINIALEKVVEAGLELRAFSTFEAMASKICGEVNASI